MNENFKNSSVEKAKMRKNLNCYLASHNFFNISFLPFTSLSSQRCRYALLSYSFDVFSIGFPQLKIRLNVALEAQKRKKRQKTNFFGFQRDFWLRIVLKLIPQTKLTLSGERECFQVFVLIFLWQNKFSCRRFKS